MKITGLLDIDEYGCLKCGDGYIIEKLSDNFQSGDKISVRFYITDHETSEEDAKKALIYKVIGGNIDDLDFMLDAYSEYTIIEYREALIIGGHDLFSELSGYVGKYLILIVEDPFIAAVREAST